MDKTKDDPSGLLMIEHELEELVVETVQAEKIVVEGPEFIELSQMKKGLQQILINDTKKLLNSQAQSDIDIYFN